ncbi:GumC family protein [Jiulongibacter sp. NS-SX5]|uniref:GumC family protein n=1 Tax=Jiulongibacter sp. NS-SX5 TaxID=3463854 RepID=UPI0040583EDF
MNNQDLNIWQEEEDDFNLRDFVFKYLRNWYWFVLSVVICSILAFLYLRYSTPIYDVSATLLVKDEEKGLTGGTEMLEELGMLGGSKLVENEIEVLRSRTLMEKVVDGLNLTVSYWHEGNIRDVELHSSSPVKINAADISSFGYQNHLYIEPLDSSKYAMLDQNKDLMGEFLYSDLVNSKYGAFRVFQVDSSAEKLSTDRYIKVHFANRDAKVSSMIEGLTAELVNQKSTVIKLGMEHALPKKGKQILGKLLDEYAFASLEDKNREATNTLNFIEDRLKLITSELGDVEQDVEQYRRSAGITDLSTEANLFLEKVKDNDTKLNEVDIQLRVLDGVERYLSSNQYASVSPGALMVSDPIITSYINQLSELELEREELARTTTANNPFLKTLQTQQANIKQAIRENIRNQKASLQVTKSGLETLNSRLESSISAIPRKERQYVEIKRQAGIKENLYLLLLEKREETALSYASTVTDSRVVDQPYTSNQPVKPKNKIVALMGLLLGLVIPAAYINGKELMTYTVQSKKEIEKETGLSVFGEIGIKPKEEKGEILNVNSRSFVSEQFRMIRSNLSYLFSDEKKDGVLGKVISITSSVPGEGKSFVTGNIAASLGLLGKKVVILGLDLRKPMIHEYLSLKNKQGVTNYLAGKAEADELILATQISNVYMIPAGPIPPNPSELLAKPEMTELVNGLKKTFDYILLDTPPTSLVTDAVLLAPLSDVCFYVIRQNKSPKALLPKVKEIKEKEVFSSMHVLFNAVDYTRNAEYGYGYGYSYSYQKGTTGNKMKLLYDNIVRLSKLK